MSPLVAAAARVVTTATRPGPRARPAASAASLVVAVAVVGVVAGFAALVATVIRIELSAAWPTEAGLPGHSV